MTSLFKNKAWLIVAIIIAIGYCLAEAGGRGDFYIFISAAGQLLAHHNIFEVSYLDSYNYFYSVFFALCLAPFYSLPFFWVKFCWLLLNLFLYGQLFQLLARSDQVKQLTARQRSLFLFLVFVFSSRFLHDNIHASQVTILILWCCIYGLYLVGRNKVLAGSAVLALGINIKLLPIVLLPYLLYRGYFKAFGCTLLFCGLALFGPSLIIGHDYNMALVKSWLHLIDPTLQRHVLDVDERSFHGLTTLLSTLLVKEVPDLYAMPLKRNIADISLATLSMVSLIVRAALVIFTLYFLRGKLIAKPVSKFSGLVEVSYLLLLIPLIFPHQQHYAFLFIVPAFAVVLYYLLISKVKIAHGQRLTVTVLLVLIYLVANLKLLLGEFNNYYEHFKILTYGALLLVPLLAWVSHQSQKIRE